MFTFQEPGESINKDLKSFQLHHSPQTDPIARLVATFDRCLERSDPEVLRHFNKRAHRRTLNVKKPIPKEVLGTIHILRKQI